jgi:Protein of unknown function (DUF3105)
MSAKSERERRRAERLAAERQELANARRRLVFGYVVAGGLTLAVLVGIVLAIGGGDDDQVGGEDLPAAAHIELQSGFLHGYQPDGREGKPPPPIAQGDLQTAAEEAGCELQLDLPDEGNTHIQPGDDPPDYETNPPTSGDHIVAPLQTADGAYLNPIDPINFVHALEHGRIEIQYDPNLPEEDQLLLKGVFDESPAGMLMFPNSDMPYDVAVTAWTNMVTCERFDPAVVDVIRDFRDTYRGQGPEPVPF